LVDEAGAVLAHELQSAQIRINGRRPGWFDVNVDVHKYHVNAPLSPAVPGVSVPLAVPRDWVVHFRKRQATPLAATR
jgi:hypothetical protein